MSPHRLAGGHLVAGDDLVVTALLLRVEADRRGPRRMTSPVRSAGATSRPAAMRTSRSRSARRERRRRARVRESRATRLAAQLLAQRPVGPGCCRSCRTAAARGGRGPAADCSASGGLRGRRRRPAHRRCRRRVARPAGLVAGLGQEPFLGSRRPPPMELGTVPPTPAVRMSVKRHGREHDGRDQRRAPMSVREATGRDRPDDEREAQDRDGVDDQHHTPYSRP